MLATTSCQLLKSKNKNTPNATGHTAIRVARIFKCIMPRVTQTNLLRDIDIANHISPNQEVGSVLASRVDRRFVCCLADNTG